MTYVVTDNCIQCRHTKCVEICPSDAFHLGPNFMVIEPGACVDCGLCVPECPEDAIYPENRLNDAQRGFIELNAELSKFWPLIVLEIEPLADHVKWSGLPNKLKYLRRDAT